MESLADLIDTHMEAVLSDWESFARQHCLPAASAMESLELRNGAASMLRALAEDIRSAQTAEEQRSKSRGERPGNAPPITAAARDHAAHRLKSGFTLRQLVAEYRALRASVVRHWTAEGGGTRSADLHQLVRFDEAMDQALTEAIQWFFESLERARDLFAGILGHDLRNPLGTVRAAAQLQQLSDSSKQRDAAERALRSIDSMEQLIRDLLDFTRTRLGEPLPISREPMELEALAREVARAFGMAKPRREFRVDCVGETAGVWDAERIQQLLSNLIKNAIVHGDAHAPILITVRGNADSAEVSVHNHGAPIPPEMLPVIFDPLTRGDRSRTRWDSREERLGLGLYIVQQVASAHGGTVEVESTAESGTTFTIRLPRFASSARDEPFR